MEGAELRPVRIAILHSNLGSEPQSVCDLADLLRKVQLRKAVTAKPDEPAPRLEVAESEKEELAIGAVGRQPSVAVDRGSEPSSALIRKSATSVVEGRALVGAGQAKQRFDWATLLRKTTLAPFEAVNQLRQGLAEVQEKNAAQAPEKKPSPGKTDGKDGQWP